MNNNDKFNLKPYDKFFGRRKGKALNQSSKDRFDNVLPKISINIDKENFNISSIFDNKSEQNWLEIGFGGGEHIAWQAQHYPNVNIIGCEPYINGIAKLLRYIQENNINNIRVYTNDARQIMDKMENASIDKAFVLFGDPWRKYKHRYRRFISPDNLDRLARILNNNAILRIATDDKVYIQWILKWTTTHPDFDWLDESPQDWGIRNDDWPQTRYEQKAIQQGRKSAYLTFRRKNRVNK